MTRVALIGTAATAIAAVLAVRAWIRLDRASYPC